MKLVTSLALAAGLAFTSAPAFAGDVDGATLMKRTCMSCHSFGEGERAKTGPNLFNVVGADAAANDGFTRYSKDMKAAAASGLTWTDENLKAYLADPTTFLREKSGNPKARSTMVFKKLSDEEVDAIVAELHKLVPAE